MTTQNIFPFRTCKKVNVQHADLKQKDLGLYLIAEVDHNYYDDSDTNFLYFDPSDSTLKRGTWTTRGYCGDFYYDYPSIYDAPQEVKDKALPVLKEYLKGEITPRSLTEQWWFSTDIAEYGINCFVEGGRKFKGKGILVKCYENESVYGVSLSVSIWDGEKMGFANPKYVKFDQQELLDKMYSFVDKMDFMETYEHVHKTFDNKYSNMNRIALEAVLPLNVVDRPVVTLEMKRDSLRAWVRDKFSDKSEEEQERITHRIMLKKYGEDRQY